MTTVPITRHPLRFLLEVVLLLGAWRFLTGRRLVGPHLTNATFLHAGTKAVGEGAQRVKVGRWHYRPQWERMLTRWAVLAAIVAAVLHRELLWAYLAAALAWATWASVRAVRTWRHDRTYVRPLHIALKALLTLPDTLQPDDYLTIPRRVPAAGRPQLARVVLPAEFNATKDARQLVSGLVLDKLGLASADVDLEYRTVGRPALVLTRAAKPPATLLLEDVLEVVDGLGPSEVLLGAGAQGLVTFDLETESPHAGFSCESGTGKSEQLGALVAQFIRKSPRNRAVVIDPKMISLEALRGVPGVTIVNDPLGDDGVQEMWAAIAGVRQEVMDRAGQLKADPLAEFDALVLVVDEANVLAALSAATWERVKPKGDKGKPPLWADLLVILAAGRRFRVHVVLVGQDLRESALGGIGLRTMLGLRGIAGYDAQAWSRFMQTRPIPAKQPGRGRWCYRIGGRDVWVQNVWGGPDPSALAAFATGRLSHVPSPDVSAGGSVDTAPGGTRIVGLEAAAAWLEVSVPAFRKARQRRPIPGETREGGRPVWDADSLRAWRAGELQEATP